MMKKIDVSFLRRGYKKAKEGRTRRLESFGQGIKILKYLQSVDISSFHHKQGSSYKELTNNIYQLRGYSFSTYSKFSKKLTFLTLFYAYVLVRKMGVRNVNFSENFAYVLNELPLIVMVTMVAKLN